MNNFIKRSITGVLFAAILLSGINLYPFGFYFLFLAITILGIREFYQLALKTGAEPQIWTGMLTAATLFTACFLHAYKHLAQGFFLLIPMVVILFIIEIYRRKKKPFHNISLTLMGLIYIGVPFSLLNYLAFPVTNEQFDPWLIMGIFVIIWANDSGAYIFGISLGKHRLFERISPKKSWEGSIGGALTALLTAWLYSKIFTGLNFSHWIVIMLIVVVFGTLGDLFESLLKRNVQIKDSGTILPGHGGILDRFDTVLLTIPMIFIYLQIVKEFFH